MKIILIRAFIVIGALLFLGGVIIGADKYFAYRNLQTRLSQFTGEYVSLAQSCLQSNESISCCLSSVETMQGVNGKPTSPNGCPTGYIVNSLKCISSQAWCEKKDLQPSDLKGAPPREIINHY